MKMIRAWRRRDLKKQTNLVTRAWQSTWQGKVTRQSIWQTCDRTVWHQKLQPIRKQNTLTHQTKTGYKNSRFGTWNFRRPWPSEVAVLYQLVVESTGSWRQTGRGTTRGGRPLTAGCWVSGSWRSTRRLQRQLTTGNWRCFVPVQSPRFGGNIVVLSWRTKTRDSWLRTAISAKGQAYLSVWHSWSSVRYKEAFGAIPPLFTIMAKLHRANPVRKYERRFMTIHNWYGKVYDLASS